MIGCKSYYYKEVSGSSLAVGITLPEEEILKIEALNWLSGEKIVVYEPSFITHSSTNTYKNSYFGVIKIDENRSSYTEISPTNAVSNGNK